MRKCYSKAITGRKSAVFYRTTVNGRFTFLFLLGAYCCTSIYIIHVHIFHCPSDRNSVSHVHQMTRYYVKCKLLPYMFRHYWRKNLRVRAFVIVFGVIPDDRNNAETCWVMILDKFYSTSTTCCHSLWGLKIQAYLQASQNNVPRKTFRPKKVK